MKYLRNGAIECAPMNDETILYDPASVKFCALNGTAAFLWDRLETPRSLGELLTELGAAYRIDDRAGAERDLQSILAELVQLSFVAANGDGDLTAPTNGDRGRDARDEQRSYGTPHMRVMDESEVLAEFQITSAGITWWVM